MKSCPTCHGTSTNFSTAAWECRPCHAARARTWRASLPKEKRRAMWRAVRERQKARGYFSTETARLRRRRFWLNWSRNLSAERRSQRKATDRSRRRGAPGKHTMAEWLEKCDLFGQSCAYCGEARKLTRDHKIPITRGGTDNIVNIVPACKSCNSAKHNSTVEEFLDRRRVA